MRDDDRISETEAGDPAALILGAYDRKMSIPPFSDSLSLHEAYAISGRVMRMRMARGERPVGWKVGFTNRNIWDEYGVHAPIWGPIYDTTLTMHETGTARCDINPLVEPRIEPEIAFLLSATPQKGMDERQLLSCIEAIGHGAEIVQSLFPGWRFRAEDTVAAFALHGRYHCGPLRPVAENEPADLLAMLSSFEITLTRNGTEADRGRAANVLDGPLSALRYFVDGFDAGPFGRGLLPGDLVTTGTLTRAFPVEGGELWQTELFGLPLPGLALQF